MLPWLILFNIIFATVIGFVSSLAGFMEDSTVRGALMLSSDDNRWISISFIMMLGIILPLAIYLAERCGYKTIFFAGLLIFVLGSLLNACAVDFFSFLISRAVAGAGAGALFPLSIAVIVQVFPKKSLTLALSLYVGLGFGIGTILGFLVSGYLVQYLSWQSSFFLCFLLGIPSLLVTALLHSETRRGTALPFDIWGYVVFIIFVSSLLLVLNSAKAEWNTEGWGSPFILTCSTLAVLSLIIFIPLELKHPNPLIALSLFKGKEFLLGCVTVFFIGAPIYATQLLSVVFLDTDLGYEKHTVGLFLSTLGMTLGIVSSLAAFLTKIFNIRILTLVGMAIISLSCFLNPDVTLYSSHGQILGLWHLRMVGVGLALGPATAFAMSKITPAFSGYASVFVTFARQVGGTIGSLGADLIAIERQVFHNEMFGAQVQPTAPAFQQVVRRLGSHLVRNAGSSIAEAPQTATSLIRASLLKQSHVTSMGDAFYILGIITLMICICLFIEMCLENFRKVSFNEGKM